MYQYYKLILINTDFNKSIWFFIINVWNKIPVNKWFVVLSILFLSSLYQLWKFLTNKNNNKHVTHILIESKQNPKYTTNYVF